MPRLPRIDGRTLRRVLERDGFVVARIEGSHHIMLKSLPGGERIVVPVPIHGHRVIKVGTLTGILRKARISRERLGKLLE
ncbi:MAG: type II toxin-antitoxin system HicA family toxin [Chloroflexi bacterium]|nr:type II toxin-antitoxin system HicA family toxin [Chloroflexota bacterium]